MDRPPRRGRAAWIGAALVAVLFGGWWTCRDGAPRTEAATPRGCGARPVQDVRPRGGATSPPRTERRTVDAVAVPRRSTAPEAPPSPAEAASSPPPETPEPPPPPGGVVLPGRAASLFSGIERVVLMWITSEGILRRSVDAAHLGPFADCLYQTEPFDGPRPTDGLIEETLVMEITDSRGTIVFELFTESVFTGNRGRWYVSGCLYQQIAEVRAAR